MVKKRNADCAPKVEERITAPEGMIGRRRGAQLAPPARGAQTVPNWRAKSKGREKQRAS